MVIPAVPADISDMEPEMLAARVLERVKALKVPKTVLARNIGKGRDYVTDLLDGRKDTITNAVLTPLAATLDCDERYFTDPTFTEPGPSRRRASVDDLDRYNAAAKFGYYTLAWREYRRLEWKEVQAESGLSPGTISDIEQGQLDPSADQLTGLAKAFATKPGLLRTNPFLTNQRVARLASVTANLEPEDQVELIEHAQRLLTRRAS